MSDERMTLTLRDERSAHAEIVRLWCWCKEMISAGADVSISARKSSRSTEQNRMLWSILTDLSEQLKWPVGGQLVNLSPEDWKSILTAGLRKEQRVAAGIDGGWVMLGQRTSKMTKGELSDLMELAWAFGAQHEINWSPTSLGRNNQPPDAALARRREVQGEPA